MDKFFSITRTEKTNLEITDTKEKSIQKTINGGQLSLKFVDKSYLEAFKAFIKSRIDDFDPLIENDKFDVMVKNMWHSYIFNNVDSSEYYNFVKILNDRIN